MGRTLAALLSMIALGGGVVLFESSGAASAASASACTSSDIVVWLKSRGEPGAGSTYYTLGLTNLSHGRCSLRGYPGVSAVDLARRQVGSAAGRNAQAPVRTVMIAPEGSAQFLLQLNDAGFFPQAACVPTTAAGLRVYLPNATKASVVPVPFSACSKQGRMYLHVAAVTS